MLLTREVLLARGAGLASPCSRAVRVVDLDLRGVVSNAFPIFYGDSRHVCLSGVCL